MSFLGGGMKGPAGPAGINIDKIDMAITELETLTDFFTRMTASCHTKCIGQRYTDADLNKGETVCIDRCVAKYSDVQRKVGEKIQNRGAAAAGTSNFTSLS